MPRVNISEGRSGKANTRKTIVEAPYSEGEKSINKKAGLFGLTVLYVILALDSCFIYSRRPLNETGRAAFDGDA